MNLIMTLEKINGEKTFVWSPYNATPLRKLQEAFEWGRQKININKFLSDRLGWWHDYSATNYEQLKNILPIYQEQDLNYVTAIQPHAKKYFFLHDLLLYVMGKDPFSGEKIIEGSPWNGKLFEIFDRLSSIFTIGGIETFPQFFEWGYPGGEFVEFSKDHKNLIFQYIDDNSFLIEEYVIDLLALQKQSIDMKIRSGYFTLSEVPNQLFKLKSWADGHNQPYDYTAAPGKRYIPLCLQRLQKAGVEIGSIKKLWAGQS